MAVIVEKDERGNAVKVRSLTFPPAREEEELASELDELLRRRIPEIEAELVVAGLLSPEMPSAERPVSGGDTRLWYELGKRLGPMLNDDRLVKPGERTWVYEAMRMYGTRRILRKDRGPTRLHLDYCYRLSRFPWEFAQRLRWGDWVFFIDSRSLRQEPRVDKWLLTRIERIGTLGRAHFRKLAQELNAIFKGKDTGVFSDQELFARYDRALEKIESGIPDLSARPQSGSADAPDRSRAQETARCKRKRQSREASSSRKRRRKHDGGGGTALRPTSADHPAPEA